MKTLVKLLFASPLLLLPACNSDTADLYKVNNPNLQSHLENYDPKPGKLGGEAGDLSIPVLPNIGPVFTVEVQKPGQLSNVKAADIKPQKQEISIKSDKQIPMMDLIFLADDSFSMDPHQRNYFDAMDEFHAQLQSLDLLSYQIGVASVYDSSRYFKVGTPGSDRYERGVREFSVTEKGKRNFYRMGRLHPLKNGGGKRFAVPTTNQDDLSETLKVGAQDFQECDIYQDGPHVANPGECDNINEPRPQDPVQNITSVLIEAQGPLKEEILAPLIAAVHPAYLLVGSGVDTAHFRAQYPRMDAQETEEDSRWTPPTGANADAQWLNFATNYNKGFIRKDAHLGVIILTDVIDGSVGINAAKAAEALRDLKGDNNSYEKITTYGVLHMNTVSAGLQKKDPRKWSVRHCVAGNKVDDAVKDKSSFPEPQMIEEFLNLTRGKKEIGQNILNICSSDYGAALASIAKDLFKKSVSLGKYELDMFPTGAITVSYKNNPAKKVPVCGTTGAEDLCFKTNIKLPPEKSRILLYNRAELMNEVLEVSYQGINLESCTALNCVVKGQ